MDILQKLQPLLPGIRFEPGDTFCWSPEISTISYSEESLKEEDGTWALVHEAGHALLSHQSYKTDFELLTLEVNAWERAKTLATKLSITISEDHIQDCLDTYRDWLHRRSTCPTCGTVSLQRSTTLYACHNCPATWTVTRARLCRPYRLLTETTLRGPAPKTQTPTFQ